MMSVATAQPQTFELVDVIDFKWLMAHEGQYVHVERLQSDEGYARACLAIAAVSPTGALRAAARRLGAALGPVVVNG